jgi:hypothetical protein
MHRRVCRIGAAVTPNDRWCELHHHDETFALLLQRAQALSAWLPTHPDANPPAAPSGPPSPTLITSVSERAAVV